MDLINALVFRLRLTINGERLVGDGSSRVRGFLLGFLLHHRPLKNTSDISLMDDNQNEWGEDEPSDAKRSRVRKRKYFTQGFL